MTRHLTLAAALIGGGVLALGAQAPVGNLDDVLNRHVAARGGLARIKAVQTLKATRTIPTLGSTLSVVIYKKRPGFYRNEQSTPGRPPIVRGLDAEGLWEQQGDKVTRRPEAMAAEWRETDADFDGMLVDAPAKGHRIELVGRTTDAGVDVYHLKVTLKSGGVRDVLLDAKTMLERKHIGHVTLPPDRKVATTWLFSDFRDVGGLQFPFAIDEDRDAMGQMFAIYVERIELDVPIDDAMFTPPAGPKPPGA